MTSISPKARRGRYRKHAEEVLSHRIAVRVKATTHVKLLRAAEEHGITLASEAEHRIEQSFATARGTQGLERVASTALLRGFVEELIAQASGVRQIVHSEFGDTEQVMQARGRKLARLEIKRALAITARNEDANLAQPIQDMLEDN